MTFPVTATTQGTGINPGIDNTTVVVTWGEYGVTSDLEQDFTEALELVRDLDYSGVTGGSPINWYPAGGTLPDGAQLGSLQAFHIEPYNGVHSLTPRGGGNMGLNPVDRRPLWDEHWDDYFIGPTTDWPKERLTGVETIYVSRTVTARPEVIQEVVAGIIIHEMLHESRLVDWYAQDYYNRYVVPNATRTFSEYEEAYLLDFVEHVVLVQITNQIFEQNGLRWALAYSPTLETYLEQLAIELNRLNHGNTAEVISQLAAQASEAPELSATSDGATIGGVSYHNLQKVTKLPNGQLITQDEQAWLLISQGVPVSVTIKNPEDGSQYTGSITGGFYDASGNGGYWHQVDVGGGQIEDVFVPEWQSPNGHSPLTPTQVVQEGIREADAGGRLPPNDASEGSGGFVPHDPATNPFGLYPILLDLNGDEEIPLQLNSESTAYFDTDNDGYAERTTWIAVDSQTGQVEDGFLVADLDGDGDITVDELAFAYQTEDPTDTDLEAFSALFDSNGDGIVNNQDAQWSSLGAWTDADQDGEVDSGELKTLGQVGITSIDVDQDSGTWVAVDGMTEAELSGFGISSDDFAFVSSPGVDDRLAGLLPGGALLYGVTRFTINGEERLAADMGLLYDRDGIQRQTDANGNIEIRAESGFAAFEISDPSGAMIDLAAGGYDAAYGGEGADTISVGHIDNLYVRAIITGGAGNDSLTGAPGEDVIAGDDGADSIAGGDGDDVLFIDAEDLAGGSVDGGAGTDLAVVSGWQDGDAGFALTLSDHALEAIHSGGGDDTISAGTVSLDGNGNPIGIKIYGGAGADVLDGGDGHDGLVGEDGDDSISGGSGDDALIAAAGADTLAGGSGNDMLDGGIDDDVIAGDGGEDTLLLGLGDDSLTGGADADTFVYSPGDGNDTITDFQPGSDHLVLGMTAAADVTVNADGSDTLITIQLAEGADTIRLVGVSPSALQSSDIQYGLVDGTDSDDVSLNGDDAPNLIVAKAGDDNIAASEGSDGVLAGAGDDTVSGGVGDDQIFGEKGNDNLDGEAGDDDIDGGVGNDTLDGQIGNDFLVGRSGDDSILGGGDNDALFGGSGHDTLDGEEGDDAIDAGSGDDSASGGEGRDSIVGGKGADTLAGNSEDDVLSGDEDDDLLSGGAGDDELIGGLGNDTATGGAGADVFAFGRGDGDDVITDFEAGVDRIDLWYTNSADVTVTADGPDAIVDTGLGTLRVQGASVAAVTAALNYSHQSGTSGNDSLAGHSGTNLLSGGAGADTLEGDGGDDALSGGSGSDNLDGGEGDDRLEAGAGNDTLTGGAGDDGFVFEINGGDNVINDFVSGEDTLVFRGLDRDDLTIEADPADSANTLITFTGGTVVLLGVASSAVAESDLVFVRTDSTDWNDTRTGTLEADSISGGYGDDRLFGDFSDDSLHGDWGDDQLSGGEGEDLLDGGQGNDALAGDRGDDTLFGGAGSDQLAGGIGSDSLTGGDDGDVFVLSEGDGIDTITDFDGLEDQLIIKVDDPSTVVVSVGAGNTVVSYGSRGDQVTLASVVLPDVLESGRVTVAWNGTDHSETRSGTDAADEVSAGEGDDSVRAGGGDDVIYGGFGNDLLIGDELASGSLPNHVITLEAWSPVNDPVDMWVRVNSAWVGAATVDADYGGAAQTVTFTVDGDVVVDDLEIGISNGSDLIIKSIDVNGRAVTRDYMTSTDLPWHYEDRYSEDLIAVNTATDVHFNIGPYGLRNDILLGGGGNDTLQGNEGYDALSGGDGSDVVEGGRGNDTLSGHAGEDTLDGGKGDDWLAGGEGNDTLTGGEGEDFFQVSFYSGDDIITDYEPGEDALYLGELGKGDVTITEDTTGSWPNQQVKTIISYVGGSVTLEGVSKGDLGELDLLYHFAGATPTDDIAIGRRGADKIEALQGNDLVDSGAGNDTIHGEFDPDETGTGPLLTIVASGEHFEGAPEMQVTIMNGRIPQELRQFGATVSSDVTYLPIAVDEVYGTDEPGAYSFRLDRSAEHSAIEIKFVNDAYGGSAATDRNLVIHEILIDGQPISTANVTSDLPSGWVDPGDGLFAKLLNDTSSMKVELSGAPKAGMNDTLSGGDGDDEVHGQGGSDYVLGGAGDDTLSGDSAGTMIRFEASGSGSIVEVWAGGTKIDTLNLTGSGEVFTFALDDALGADSIQFIQTNIRYTDVTYQDGIGEPSVFQYRQFTNVARIDEISVDGQLWSSHSIRLGPTQSHNPRTPEFKKTFGFNGLAVGFGEDTIDGGAGNDVVSGGALGDTFRFIGEHGSDVIEDFEEGVDTIELDIDDPSSLTITNNGTDTTLTHADGSIIVKGVVWSAPPTDGSLVVLQNGTFGADTLTGGAADERFDAGAGNDSLSGGGGTNRYVFEVGDGQDTIADFDVTKDVIDLGELTQADYQVVQVGSDTEIRYGSDGDVVTLAGINSADLGRGSIETVSAIVSGDNGPDVFSVADGDGVTIIKNFQESVDVVELSTGNLASVSVSTANGDTEISYGSGDVVVLKNVVLPNIQADGKLKLVWIGSSGADSQAGTAGDDHLKGMEGADTLSGNGGADTLDGGAGNDSLQGQAAADVLLGGTDNDTLLGGSNDDLLDGGAGNDSLNGEDGNDRIAGGAGSDTMIGGGGKDSFLLAFGDGWGRVDDYDLVRDRLEFDGFDKGDLTFKDDGAHVTIEYGDGDVLSIRNQSLWLTIEYIYNMRVTYTIDGTKAGTSGADNLTGLSGGDYEDGLFGDDGNDTLSGLAGEDVLVGGRGNDHASGGDGLDELWGGSGDDTLKGDAGADNLAGGFGDDEIVGGTGNDVLWGDLSGDGFRINSSNYTSTTSGFDFTALDTDGSTVGTYVDQGLMGPSGSVSRGLGYSATQAASEKFVIDFDDRIALADITVAYLMRDEGGTGHHEVGMWTAYLDGEVVGSGTFTGNTSGIALVRAAVAGGFDKLELSALPYENGQNGITSESSDYWIARIVTRKAIENVAGGSDTFKFSIGDGVDQILDFDVTKDIIDFGGLTQDDYEIVQVGDNTEIRYGTSDKVVLLGVDAAFLDGSNVLGLNSAPTGITLAAMDVVEHAQGAVVGALAVADPDAGDSHTFTVDDDRFEVVSGELKLKSGVELDHEVESTVSVTVTATDARGLSTGHTFVISVSDENEAPTDILLDSLRVSENQAGAVVGTLTAADPDANDTHGFTVSDSRFEVIGDLLKLKDGQTLDRGVEPEVNLTVTGTDQGGLPTSKVFTLTVLPPNIDVALEGTPQADLIDGTSLREEINGLGENDTLDGASGHDVLNGGFGNDSLLGGLDNDRLHGDLSQDLMAGEIGGADVLEGGDGGDTLSGDSGDDLESSAVGGADTLRGGAGGDLLFGDAVDNIKGSSTGGDDSLVGGDADDTLYGDAGNDLQSTAIGGNDTVEGGRGNDTVAGDAEDLKDNSQGGHDTLYGNENDDLLFGDVSDDILHSSVGGNDLLFGGSGIDTLAGDGEDLKGSSRGGDDTLHGEDGNDVQFGDASDDIQLDAVGGNDLLYGGAGHDVLAGDAEDLKGNSQGGADTLHGQDGNDVQFGDASDDILLNALGGNDLLYGGAGNDVLAGDAKDLHENSRGGDDTLHGDAGNDQLFGDASVYLLGSAVGGNDLLDGGAGNDTLYGDAGSESSTATGGSDTLVGGAGDDSLIGGSGADLFTFWVGDGDDTINDFDITEDRLSLGVNDPLSVSVTVSGGNTVISYGNSGDQITLLGVTDTGKIGLEWSGTAGADTINGSIAADIVSGGDGNDALFGQEGSDELFGQEGNDTLAGGGGNDVFWGNSGSDVLVIDAASGDDTIKDFEQGADLIRIERTGVSFSDLTITDHGSYRLVQIGSDTVRVEGLSTGADLTVADFEFLDGSSSPPSNQAPTAIGLDNTTVDENAAGAAIGALTVTDPDAGDPHSFTVNDSRFEVVSGQLKLKAAEALDHEAEATVSVTVTATDAGGLSTNQTFNISVTNANEAPTGISLNNASVTENATGAAIGTLSTIDPDAGDSRSYSVDDARFEVVGGQLKLKAGEALNHEVDGTVSITVTATDAGGLSTNETFDVVVLDANEAPTSIALGNDSVDENAAGAVIGAVSVTDPDANDSHNYTVSDTRFEVIGGQLRLKAGQTLDAASEPTVSVTITATDSGGLSVDETFVVTVVPAGSPAPGTPSAVLLDVSAVLEGANAGAAVGQLSVIDADVGDSHTLEVLNDSRFEIVGGQLKLKDGVTLAGSAGTIVTLQIKATDSSGLSHTETIQVRIVDDLVLGTSASETLTGQTGLKSGVFGLDGADRLNGDKPGIINGSSVGGDDILVGGNGDDTISGDAGDDLEGSSTGGNDTIDGGAGNDLLLGDAADRMEATSTGGDDLLYGGEGGDTISGDGGDHLWGSAVSGGNDTASGGSGADLLVGDTTARLIANAIGGDDVLHGDAGDDTLAGDAGTYLTDSSTGGHDSLYGGDGNDLLVGDALSTMYGTTAGGFDHLDGGAGNDTLYGDAPVLSGSSVGGGDTLIGGAGDDELWGKTGADLYVFDPGSGSDTIMDFEQGVDHIAFRNAGIGFGDLSITDNGDHRLVQFGSDTIAVHGLPAGAQLTDADIVFINGTNSAPTAILLSNAVIDENASGAVVGTLTVTDPDASDNHVFAVNDDRFEVVGGDLKLKAGVVLDHETEPAIMITVAATDSGWSTALQDFTVTVTDVNEAPSDIQLDNFTVDENAAGAVVGSITSTDPDASDAHTYSVSDNRFEIVGGQLKLKDGATLSYGSEPTVTVTVTATDAQGLARSEDYELSVLPPTAPSSIWLDAGAVLASASSGAIIGQLFAEDINNSESHTFEVIGSTHFEVVNGQLKLKDGVSPVDLGGVGSTISVTVKATDSSGLSRTEQMQVAVVDTLLLGSAVDDSLASSLGSNAGVFGSLGNDSLYGETSGTLFNSDVGGNDVLGGGAGDDLITGDAGRNLQGASIGGDDSLFGDVGADTLRGDANGMHENSVGGNDTLDGGPGDDLLLGESQYMQSSSQGADDVLLGGEGNDSLYGEAVAMNGGLGGGNDTLDGGVGDDVLAGDAGDYLGRSAVGGDDSLSGGDGSDTLYGDALRFSGSSSVGGNDSLEGGAGNDSLYGDAASGVNTRGGNDTLVGGTGDDQLWGNSGADVFAFMDGDGADTINDFEQGVDLIRFDQTGLDFSDLIITDQGNHRLVQYGANVITVYGLQIGASLTAADILFQ